MKKTIFYCDVCGKEDFSDFLRSCLIKTDREVLFDMKEVCISCEKEIKLSVEQCVKRLKQEGKQNRNG